MLRAALLMVLLVISAAAHAQLVESIEVRVTNLDVIVTDRSGNPVTGLTKEDFVVTEEGREQLITNFHEIRGAATAGAVTEPAAASAPPVVPEKIAARRIVVFVDNYTIHPLARNRAFAALEQALHELVRDGDQAMIVFWDRRLRVVAPFTGDRARLISRFREASKKSSGGMSFQANRTRVLNNASQMIAEAMGGGRHKMSIGEAYRVSLGAAVDIAEEMYTLESRMLADLKQTIRTLAGVEGKKALIYLGAEMPADPYLDVFQQIDAMFSPHMRLDRPSFIREMGKRSLATEMRSVAHDANANGVTMYMVDTADRDRRGDPTEGPLDPGAEFLSQTNTPIAMGMVASITGGIAVIGAKTFEQALDTIVRDLASYYSIGYRSPAEGEGRRDVKVRTKRTGLRVRSRSSYIARSPEEGLRDRVIANVFHANVASDFAITVVAAKPERQPDGQYKVPLTITFPSSMTLIPQGDQLAGEFNVYIATGTEEGAVSEVTKRVQPMKFPAGTEERLRQMGTFEYKAALLIRAGEQVVSVAVVDTIAGTAGFARETVIAGGR